MSAFAITAGIRLKSQAVEVTSPATAKVRLTANTNTELDAIRSPSGGVGSRQGHAPMTPGSQTPVENKTGEDTGAQTPRTLNELEASRPTTPRQAVASIVPSIWYPYMNRWRVLASCLVYLANGINDSSPGAMIPYLEEYYTIGYAVVSLIFVTNAVGFILAAFFADAICSRFGRAKSLMLSEVFMIAAYVVVTTAPPFGVVVAAYLILGFGNALNLAYNNVFCAGLAQPTVILGLAHGSYGIGGILGPIIATSLVSAGVTWSRFYLIAIGIRAVCLFLVGWSFWNYEAEATTHLNNDLERLTSRQRAEDLSELNKLQLLRRALADRAVIIGALFIFAYQGAEVADSGWFISYLINYRDGDPRKVGYVTSGFWAGITVGRFVLTHAAHRVGEKQFVFALGIASVAFQLLAWLVPSIIGDSVAVAILGLVLGPVYPCAQTVFSRLLPRNIQVIGISFISSAGSSGGAFVPLMTGLIAEGVGTYVLHPICIGFFALMIVCWALLPSVAKRDD